MNSTKPLVVISLALGIGSAAIADDHTESGYAFMQICNDQHRIANDESWTTCSAYVTGISHGLVLASVMATEQTSSPNKVENASHYIEKVFGFCEPDGVTVAQEILVFTKYLHDHPEVLQKPASVLVVESFKEAWPCKT